LVVSVAGKGAKAKPFDIPKREVWEAFKKVKANQGAAGVDGQSIADFEIDLKNNLYKLSNRLSSGSYLPQAVRRVDIPKAERGRWFCRAKPRVPSSDFSKISPLS
jgi:retron-type reverse transcriptase